jgi:lipopolysaccharide transport system permease protein
MMVIKQHWYLIRQLAKREVESRYKGSLLGTLWTILNPLMMLAVYGFVFTAVFPARWPGLVDTGQEGFVLVLFTGLIIFSLASDTWNRAPGLVLENPSYVKKVVFPLYLLPIVALAPPLVQACSSFALLLVGYVLIIGVPDIKILLVPLVALLYCAVVLAVSYVLAAIGTFVPDLRHAVGSLMTIFLFGSPVFYPLSALPQAIQPLVALSPLTFYLEASRALLFGGDPPAVQYWLLAALAAMVSLAAGLILFHKAGKGFADVL